MQVGHAPFRKEGASGEAGARRRTTCPTGPEARGSRGPRWSRPEVVEARGGRRTRITLSSSTKKRPKPAEGAEEMRSESINLPGRRARIRRKARDDI
jgi:hypothetical protein